MDLTNKQRRFCEEYLVDFNATQAAIRAGYSQHTASEIGNENLRKPQIKKIIDERAIELAERSAISVDRILTILSDIAEHGDKDRNRLRACELLGKYHGMFTEKLEVKNADLPRAVILPDNNRNRMEPSEN